MSAKAKTILGVWLALGGSISAYWAGYFRSWDTAFSGGTVVMAGLYGVLIITLFVLVGDLACKMFRIELPAVSRQVMIVALLVVLAICSAELWCGIEEHRFAKETEISEDTSYARARWWPYTSHGLCVQDGKVYGHD